MADEKIYLTSGGGDSGLSSALVAALQNRGVDPSVVSALSNNNGWGFGGNNDLLGLIILFAIFGGGFGNWGGGWGGNNGAGTTEREMIMSAIQRNGVDVNNIAQALNVSTGQVNAGINALGLQLANMAGQQGLSAQQLINSIQAGNATIASQLCNGFCSVNSSIINQGYQNQIANLQQTGVLADKIDNNTAGVREAIQAQSVMITDKFCQQEMREMQNKIDALREEKNTLASALETTRQTQNLKDNLAAVVAPLSAAIASIQTQVNALAGAGAATKAATT